MLHTSLRSFVLFVVMTLSHALVYGQVEMDEFRVPLGTTVIIGPRLQNIIVKRLVLEDESTIQLSPELCSNGLPCSWTIFAEEAIIGLDTRIFGKGDSGSNGDPGERGRDGDRCKGGSDAPIDGGDGGHGANGISIRATLGIAKIGSLYIESSGGNGGNGGHGANGGNGGRGSCGLNCKGGNGGRGSDGGNGGYGGNGGDIHVEFWSVGDARVNIGPSSGIWASSVRGNEGDAGRAGNGGAAGGASGNCGIWPYWRRGGGVGGAAGKAGTEGMSGVDGMLVFSPTDPKDP